MSVDSVLGYMGLGTGVSLLGYGVLASGSGSWYCTIWDELSGVRESRALVIDYILNANHMANGAVTKSALPS